MCVIAYLSNVSFEMPSDNSWRGRRERWWRGRKTQNIKYWWKGHLLKFEHLSALASFPINVWIFIICMKNSNRGFFYSSCSVFGIVISKKKYDNFLNMCKNPLSLFINVFILNIKGRFVCRGAFTFGCSNMQLILYILNILTFFSIQTIFNTYFKE